MKQHYELMFITSVKLDEKAQQEALNKVAAMIAKEEGAAAKPEIWGSRRLAYEINHQTNGHYTLIEFDLESERLKKLDAALRMMPELIRYLVIRKKVKTPAELKKEKDLRARIAAKKEAAEKAAADEALAKEEAAVAPADTAPADTAAPKKGDDQKISLDDLDKKLDDILKEDV